MKRFNTKKTRACTTVFSCNPGAFPTHPRKSLCGGVRRVNAGFLVCTALLFLGLPAAGQTPLSPRDAETRAFNELRGRLEAKKIDFTLRPLMADYGAFGSSVEVNIPAGPDSAGGLFVLAVPIIYVPDQYLLNGTEYRPSGDGLGWCVELALGFIDKLLSVPRSFHTIVYFAADNWPGAGGSAVPYAGFQALLDKLPYHEGTAIVYCDSPVADGDDPDALTVLRGAGAASSPLALVEPLIQLCGDAGIPCFFVSDDGGGGLAGAANRFEAAAGRQLVYLSGDTPARFKAPPDGKKITSPEAAALLYRYAEKISAYGINTDEADHGYAYIGLGHKRVFIPELTLVLITLFGMVFVFVMCFCLYYAAKSHYKYVLIPVFAVFALLPALFLFVLHTNGGQNLPVRKNPPEARTRVVRDTGEAGRYFTASSVITRFLDHRIVKIGMEARLLPLQYSLFFTNQPAGDTFENHYFIYDAPMPYYSDGKRIEFILGSYPPNPLNIEIALPPGLAGEFSIEGIFPGDVKVISTFPVPAENLPDLAGPRGL
jgi:hypothetical protein